MGTFANPETLFDNSTNGPTVEQALQQMRDNQRAIMELEGAKPTEVCTISTTNINTNGTIYPSSAEVVVTLPENTNSLSAVLTDISPSYERTTGVYEMLHDGMVVSLKSEFNSYRIELVSSETLRLKTAERITLSHLYPLKLKLVLGNNGDYYWEEVPNAGTHSGDITSISGNLVVSGDIISNGVTLGRRMQFESTPFYTATLAEKIENVNDSNSYKIELSDYVQNKVKAFILHVTFPAYTQSGTTGSLRVRVHYTKEDGTDEYTAVGQANNILSTGTRYFIAYNSPYMGLIDVFCVVGNFNGAGGVSLMMKSNSYQPRLLDMNQYFLKGIDIYFNSDNIPFPKGTVIEFYVAKEV